MAYQIEAIRRQYSTTAGTTCIEADISVDTVANLPDVDAADGYLLLDGTICLVRQTGDFYILDSETWYAADGSGAADSDDVNASVNSTRGLTKTAAPEQTDEIVPEIDDAEPETDEITEPEPEEPAEDGEMR